MSIGPSALAVFGNRRCPRDHVARQIQGVRLGISVSEDAPKCPSMMVAAIADAVAAHVMALKGRLGRVREPGY